MLAKDCSPRIALLHKVRKRGPTAIYTRLLVSLHIEYTSVSNFVAHFFCKRKQFTVLNRSPLLYQATSPLHTHRYPAKRRSQSGERQKQKSQSQHTAQVGCLLLEEELSSNVVYLHKEVRIRQSFSVRRGLRLSPLL